MSFQTRRIDAAGAEAEAPPARCPQRRTGLPGLLLVVPCYNEAARLDGARFVAALRADPGLGIVFVNDGSRDGTLAVLRDLQAQAPGQIEILDLKQNAGKAEAVRQGLLHAVGRGAALTGYWDADLATPLEVLPDFTRVADRFDGIDVIFGSRRRMLGHRIDRTLKRRLVSALCAQLARLALRLPIRDTQCGAKLLRPTAALRYAIAQPFTAGWLFDVELFARIAERTGRGKVTLYELPLSEWAEVAGSKVSARAIVKSGFRMLNLIAARRLGLAFPVPVPEGAEARVILGADPARLAA